MTREFNLISFAYVDWMNDENYVGYILKEDCFPTFFSFEIQ